MNSDVPSKTTGQTLSAAEINNIVQAVNSKQDALAQVDFTFEVLNATGGALTIVYNPLRPNKLINVTADCVIGVTGSSDGNDGWILFLKATGAETVGFATFSRTTPPNDVNPFFMHYVNAAGEISYQ